MNGYLYLSDTFMYFIYSNGPCIQYQEHITVGTVIRNLLIAVCHLICTLTSTYFRRIDRKIYISRSFF